MQHKPYIFHAKEVMCDYAYRLIDVYKQGTLNQITKGLQLPIATFFCQTSYSPYSQTVLLPAISWHYAYLLVCMYIHTIQISNTVWLQIFVGENFHKLLNFKK